MGREFPPEHVGVLSVDVIGPEGSEVDAIGMQLSGTGVVLKVGAIEGDVVVAFPVGVGVVSLGLTTRQAYHLAAALQRSRARALRQPAHSHVDRSLS